MKLEKEEIFFINQLDKQTGVIAKDCLVSGKTVTFLIKNPEMGKAIGKNGKKIKSLTKKLGRKIELIAFFDGPKKFFKKALPKTEFEKIKAENNSIILKVNSMEKKKIKQKMGKFKRIKKLAERNYNIESVKLK